MRLTGIDGRPRYQVKPANLTRMARPWQRVCLCEKGSGATADSKRPASPQRGAAAGSFSSGDSTANGVRPAPSCPQQSGAQSGVRGSPGSPGEGLEPPLSRSCGWAWGQIPKGLGRDPDGPGERLPVGLGRDPRWAWGETPDGPGDRSRWAWGRSPP